MVIDHYMLNTFSLVAQWFVMLFPVGLPQINRSTPAPSILRFHHLLTSTINRWGWLGNATSNGIQPAKGEGIIYYILRYLGKLQYVSICHQTELRPLGDYSPSKIPVRSQWGHYSLPRYAMFNDVVPMDTRDMTELFVIQPGSGSQL